MKPYNENHLANSIYGQSQISNFGEGRSLKPVISFEDVEKMSEEGLGLDYRAKTKETEGYGSVFEGLAFDEKAVRSQSFAVYEGEKPIGVMTVVIAPKFWIEQQRYLQNENGGVKVVDAKKVIGSSSTPDFFVIPAWTNVVESHKTKIALPGFRTFKNILTKIEEQSPDNTYIEMIAQGQLTNDKQKELDKLLESKHLDSFISENELPFDIDLLGKNSEGSSSTVKMAKILDYVQADNICSAGSLGPVFYKKIK